jgi:hypothetical protein
MAARRRPRRRTYADFTRLTQNRRLSRHGQIPEFGAKRRLAISLIEARTGRSVQAFAVAQPFDLVLHLQFFTLELHDSQVIDRGMGQAVVEFGFERLMLFFEFREMRLHRHEECLLNQWHPDELSLAQTQFKSDGTLGRAPQQSQPKSLIGGHFSRALNGLVENAIIIGAFEWYWEAGRSDQRWR